eukprot:7106773-Prymnesium_polylepis.1
MAAVPPRSWPPDGTARAHDGGTRQSVTDEKAPVTSMHVLPLPSSFEGGAGGARGGAGADSWGGSARSPACKASVAFAAFVSFA